MTAPLDSSLDNSYQYEFGFCQMMSEAKDATCRNDVYAIGSAFNTTQYQKDKVVQPPTDCTFYSGDTTKVISAETISLVINQTSGEVKTGVALTYSGGPACVWTGAPTSFTIKVWCDSSISIEDSVYSGMISNDDPCAPLIEIYSSVGGCDLLANSIIWEYLTLAEP